AEIRRALLRGTVTFQRMELIRIRTNWYENPPEVHLTVRTPGEITPRQVPGREDGATFCAGA
ncbi:MAG: hypothetical protein RMI89_07905, partial [Gloeomargarita sp. SKYBB_i_bin120]|nr:hypothetical protein [Gloeomargarita sp. SKYB120]MDW8178445.1 hypothetical protein [Gloeomargarita sp. SKYBB_i_bin120]